MDMLGVINGRNLDGKDGGKSLGMDDSGFRVKLLKRLASSNLKI